eukprot:CAMPEP_0178847882 /NCGR_PEP_ID=MMETSP0746-20121128/18949_1 /TAXON_ID=913974 /ORGANISM="Nitzschia punctata, Strain CCMP561" /LENGTH=99 /DNA_ID=CAMNT_0020512657 /DNA_START=37 /DNA_END=336 /DNA_ORIENTATION=-
MDEWRYRNVLWSTWWPLEEPSNEKTTTSKTLQQAIWLLDGGSPEISNLRMDGTAFGPDCPNTVFEDFFGTPVGDIFLIDGNLYFASNHPLLYSSPSIIA